jgi:hypothetical protein
VHVETSRSPERTSIPSATSAGQWRRTGTRHGDLQREAARRRRAARTMMAASLVLLGAMFALFYTVLSG